MDKKWKLAHFFFLNFPLELILTVFSIPLIIFSRSLFLLFIIYVIYSITIIAAGYRIFMKLNRAFYKFLALDFTHTLFLAPIVFVLIAAMGGVSQAVVEGVAGDVFYRYGQYTIYTVFVLFIAQILIVPWCLFTNHLMRKPFNRNIIKTLYLSLLGIIIAYGFIIGGCQKLWMRSPHN